MSLSTQVLNTINLIAEELSPDECKRLSYLCGEIHNNKFTRNVKEILQSFMVQGQTDKAFLIELMLKMKRYDLLSKVLGISRPEAEQLLKNGHTLSDYRVLMADLSEDFGSEDLESLLFLLRGTLPKEKIEHFECFLDVVVELEKLDKISSTRMDIMEKYLKAIRRVDLAKKLNQYQSRAAAQKPAPVKPRDERQPCRTPLPSIPTVFPAAACSARKCATPCVKTPGHHQSIASKPYEQRQEDVYRMWREPRGLCLIIDCVGNEGDHLEQLFTSLHFRVSRHMLLSARDMRSCLQNISRQTEHYNMDAFICCIISRSHSSQLLGTDSYGRGLDLNTVRQFFTPCMCPGLTGKPKLFFIQSYEVSRFCEYREEDLETDGPVHHQARIEKVPEDADIFWSQCWTNEKQLEESDHQSVYVQSLKEALIDGQNRRSHLVDLHMAVNRAVYTHNHSHPQSAYHINLKHTLRKNLYLS